MCISDALMKGFQEKLEWEKHAEQRRGRSQASLEL